MDGIKKLSSLTLTKLEIRNLTYYQVSPKIFYLKDC